MAIKPREQKSKKSQVVLGFTKAPKSLGKISKVSLTHSRHRVSIRTNDEESRKRVKYKQQVIRNWIFAIMALSVFAFAGALLYNNYAEFSVPVKVENSVKMQDVNNEITKALNDPREKSTLLAKQFLNAREKDDWNGLVRIGQIDQASAFERFAEMKEKFGEPGRIIWLGVFHFKFVEVEYFYFELGEKGRLFLPILSNENQEKQVDIDSLLSYNKYSSDDLIEGRKVDDIFRISIEASNYFIYPFTPEEEWLCFKVVLSEKDSNNIYAYCKRDSAVAKTIGEVAENYAQIRADWLDLGGNFPFEKIRLSVRGKSLDDARPNQLLITEILSDDWVIP